MKDRRLERLVQLAGLVRDDRLARLAAAVARRDDTVALRDGLVAVGSVDPAALRAQAVHAIWVEGQRRVLALQIDQQEAEIAVQLGAARTAFARAQALEKLRDQLS